MWTTASPSTPASAHSLRASSCVAVEEPASAGVVDEAPHRGCTSAIAPASASPPTPSERSSVPIARRGAPSALRPTSPRRPRRSRASTRWATVPTCARDFARPVEGQRGLAVRRRDRDGERRRRGRRPVGERQPFEQRRRWRRPSLRRRPPRRPRRPRRRQSRAARGQSLRQRRATSGGCHSTTPSRLTATEARRSGAAGDFARVHADVEQPSRARPPIPRVPRATSGTSYTGSAAAAAAQATARAAVRAVARASAGARCVAPRRRGRAPGSDDGVELEALRLVHRHHLHARRPRPRRRLRDAASSSSAATNPAQSGTSPARSCAASSVEEALGGSEVERLGDGTRVRRARATRRAPALRPSGTCPRAASAACEDRGQTRARRAAPSPTAPRRRRTPRRRSRVATAPRARLRVGRRDERDEVGEREAAPRRAQHREPREAVAGLHAARA